MFATYEDVKSRWPHLEAPEGQVVALIEDASLWVATMYTIRQPVSPQVADVLRLVVCAMVARSVAAGEAGNVASQSYTAGPFAQQVSFVKSEGSFYLKAAEKDLLEAALAGGGLSQGGMSCVEAVGW